MIRIVLITGLLLMASIFMASANSCIECHSNLAYQISEKEQYYDKIRIQHMQRGVPCSVECHVDATKRLAIEDYIKWKNSLHGAFGVTCDRCHGGNPESPTKEGAHQGLQTSRSVDSAIYYKNVPAKCGECHYEEYYAFIQSEHYARLEANDLAPTCFTCHEIHSTRVLKSDEIAPACMNCHNEVTGILASAPKDAEELLSMLNQMDREINQLKSEIQSAKRLGKDTSEAEEYLLKAEVIRAGLPKIWHTFDFNLFRNKVEEGLKYLEESKNSLGISVETEKQPGFGILLGIGAFVLLALRNIKKR